MDNKAKIIKWVVVIGLIAVALYVWPILIGPLGFVGFLFLLSGIDGRRRAAFEQAVRSATEPHLRVLVRKQLECLRPDEYGVVTTRKWDKELARFLDGVIFQQVSPPGLFSSGLMGTWTDKAKIAAIQIVRNRIAEAGERHSAQQVYDQFSFPTDGREYEQFCADMLRRAGWNVQTTPASGDQGVDLVATRGDQSVAVQCKRYDHPVSNAAVQQASTGRIHYGTRSAAVVSNSSFTRGAEKLAATTGVLLLHHSDLPTLTELLLNKASAAASSGSSHLQRQVGSA